MNNMYIMADTELYNAEYGGIVVNRSLQIYKMCVHVLVDGVW